MATTVFPPWSFLGRVWALPVETAIAVPSRGWSLFRLVKNDPPEASDFRPVSASYAERQGLPEILRLGLSHFQTPDQARTWMWSDEQLVARVRIPNNARIYVARTDHDRPGHIEVWCPADLMDDLVESAEVVE
jgi:hypothetical protein